MAQGDAGLGFSGAIGRDSTCEQAYWQRADYLLARWFGEPGESEAWLHRAAAPLAPDQADRVYASVCSRMSYFHRDLFVESSVSWPRMRRGLQLLLADHPHSQALAQEFAFNASLAGDVASAHEMFRRTGARCDLKVWRDKRVFTTFCVGAQMHSTVVRAAATR